MVHALIATVTLLPIIDDDVRLNQVQVIGTHNSYHIAPTAAILDLLKVGGDRVKGLDYTHKPLAEQFQDLGIRQVELDLFADPDGGLYASPAMRKTVKTLGKDPGPDPNVDGVLDRPGMKVLHVQDIDFLSTAPTFVAALKQIKDWSIKHSKHVPIFVLVELKDDAVLGTSTKPVEFDASLLDAVEAEALSVFDRSDLFTPDDLRGDSPSLPHAIAAKGWPRLDALRGKVILGLDNEGALRDLYVQGHEALKGRLMFATMDGPDHAAAAWFKINDPLRDFDRIQDLVRKGFLIRTRADADTREARANDGTRRDKALASGAQFVSTDYPEPRLEFSGYQVKLPGKAVARPNPVSLPGRGDGELE